MDGVLIDSEPLWQDTQIELFGAIGVELTRDMCRTTMGHRIDEVVSHWYEMFRWSGPSVNEMVSRIVDGMVAAVSERGQPMPGAIAALDMMRGAGLKLGLATSSYRSLTDAVLRTFELESAFDAIVTGDDVQRSKPHPDIYFRSLELLGSTGWSAVAIEDSTPGLRAARAAGMACIAVPVEVPASEVAPVAHLVLDSLEELDAPCWRSFVASLEDEEPIDV